MRRDAAPGDAPIGQAIPEYRARSPFAAALRRLLGKRIALLGAIRLRELREARGLSQTELARRLGVSQKRVSAIERAHDLNLSTLQRYVSALGGQLKADVEFEGETIALTPPRRGHKAA